MGKYAWFHGSSRVARRLPDVNYVVQSSIAVGMRVVGGDDASRLVPLVTGLV
jgi:hypothetical protein